MVKTDIQKETSFSEISATDVHSGPTRRNFTLSRHTHLLSLTILKLANSLITVVLGICAVVLKASSQDMHTMDGSAIYGGIVLSFSASLGIVGISHRKRTMVLIYLTLSIFEALVCCPATLGLAILPVWRLSATSMAELMMQPVRVDPDISRIIGLQVTIVVFTAICYIITVTVACLLYFEMCPWCGGNRLEDSAVTVPEIVGKSDPDQKQKKDKSMDERDVEASVECYSVFLPAIPV